jgi:sugar-specific transcriptional regulator TrmB
MQEILRKIGLTRGESDVYITLLKIGNTTSGALINKSGVSRSKVYEVLERLKKKGLVTEMIKQNTKYFEATSPTRITDYIKSQQQDLAKIEEEAKKVIPTLIQLQKEHIEKQETRIYTGFEGWKTLYTEILDRLKPGEEYLAFGIGPQDLKDKQVERFFRKFHLRRAEKHIHAKIIMNPETRKVMEERFSDLKHYKYRFLDTNFPTNINIHKNNVAILVWGKNPVAFLIHSKQVADKYRTYFNELWKLAKKD